MFSLQDMHSVIESARLHVNGYVLEHGQHRIGSELAHAFIENCKLALLNSDSYGGMAKHLYDGINTSLMKQKRIKWHVLVFSSEGGESVCSGINYFRIRFNNLIIELFCTPM